MESSLNACRMCSGNLRPAAESLAGYVAGKSFRILHCQQCGTAVADPATSDSAVYQAIYSQADRVPSYARYFRYAKEIATQRFPWRYLRSREECYWGIGAALDELYADKDVTILEVGCGLGYLTYGLTSEGYRRVLGIDVAAPAIAAAKARFNCEYAVADASVYVNETTERFDAIIMTEVLEHLEHPVEFVSDVRKLLKPGGYLICTTPSRDFGGHPQQIWATDLPPVHLWWFTERGLVALSRQLGLSARFVDFSKWNRQHFTRFERALRRSRRAGEATPTLTEGGAVMQASQSAAKSRSLRLEALKAYLRGKIYHYRNSSSQNDPISRSAGICVIFRDGQQA